MLRAEWLAMGCLWSIQVWDELSLPVWSEVQTRIIEECTAFDETFSRFKKTSLIWRLANTVGKFSVPPTFIEMLHLYQRLYRVTGGRYNPLIGNTISDLGYDAEYSLTPKAQIRLTPSLLEAVEIIDEQTIRQNLPVMFDVGALGKGYFVDRASVILREYNIQRFLVNGSGDVFYQTAAKEPLLAGLEHPGDASMVIGRTKLVNQAMCASSGNRRKWDKYHHIIDPLTQTSPNEILASWIKAETTMLADGLATAAFLVPVEELRREFVFEYCLLNPEYKVKRSAGFEVELY